MDLVLLQNRSFLDPTMNEACTREFPWVGSRSAGSALRPSIRLPAHEDRPDDELLLPVNHRRLVTTTTTVAPPTAPTPTDGQCKSCNCCCWCANVLVFSCTTFQNWTMAVPVARVAWVAVVHQDDDNDDDERSVESLESVAMLGIGCFCWNRRATFVVHHCERATFHVLLLLSWSSLLMTFVVAVSSRFSSTIVWALAPSFGSVWVIVAWLGTTSCWLSWALLLDTFEGGSSLTDTTVACLSVETATCSGCVVVVVDVVVGCEDDRVANWGRSCSCNS